MYMVQKSAQAKITQFQGGVSPWNDSVGLLCLLLQAVNQSQNSQQANQSEQTGLCFQTEGEKRRYENNKELFEH